MFGVWDLEFVCNLVLEIWDLKVTPEAGRICD
jgi:hypothetical protein